MTPMHELRWQQNIDLTKLLLQYGANPNLITIDPDTGIQYTVLKLMTNYDHDENLNKINCINIQILTTIVNAGGTGCECG